MSVSSLPSVATSKLAGSAFGRLFKGPSAPKLPKRSRELSRLSLSQLTRKEGRLTRKKGKQQLLRRTGGRTDKILKAIGTAKSKLIRQGTAQRAGRATSVANLLTRGF